MRRRAYRAFRRHRRLLAAIHSARPPIGPEPPGMPLLTYLEGWTARGVTAGNQLVIDRQVLRGDQP